MFFRTTDALRWGKGQGFNLAAAQADRNFWDLYEELQGAIGHVETMAVSIAYVTVTGNQLTVVLTDHSRQGPFTIPTAEFLWGGAWNPDTSYSRGTLLTNGNALYFVLESHTSGAHFSADAVDGAHHPLYALVLEAPEGVLPPHGITGQALVKRTNHDFDVEWATIIGVPGGGGVNQVLTKTSDADYSMAWLGVPYVPSQIESFSSGTFTPDLTDANTYQRYTGSSGTIVTLPLNASVEFNFGDEISFRQASTGTITVAVHSGATLHGVAGFTFSTAVKGAVITVKLVGVDTWDTWGMFGT